MFKKVLSTVLLIVMVFAVSLPCSAAVVTDGEKFYAFGDANGDGTMAVSYTHLDVYKRQQYYTPNNTLDKLHIICYNTVRKLINNSENGG